MELTLRHAKRAVKRALRIEDENWNRAAEIRATRKLVEDLGPGKLSALEISGHRWQGFGFGQYEHTTFDEAPSPCPENLHTRFDLCATKLDKQFDLVIAEHIFEHLLYPYRGVKNVFSMIKPGGHFLISVPFLVRVHRIVSDCTRWTEEGMRHFLEEAGFPLDGIVSGAWGNRACVVANFDRWVPHRGVFQPMNNEENFPVVVWALARKPVE